MGGAKWVRSKGPFIHEEREGGRYISRRSKGGYVILVIWPLCGQGEGVKNTKIFVDVLYEWSLTKVVLNLVLGISQKCVQGRGEGAKNNSAYMLNESSLNNLETNICKLDKGAPPPYDPPGWP